MIVIGSECGDWWGMFIDGELFVEGHAIYEKDWINAIQTFQHFDPKVDCYNLLDEYLEHIGNFPFYFKDIPKDLLSGGNA